MPFLLKGGCFFSGENKHQPQDRGIADFVSRYDDVRKRRWAWRRCRRLRLRRGTKAWGKKEREKRKERKKALEAYRDVIIVPPLQSTGKSGRYTQLRKSGYEW